MVGYVSAALVADSAPEPAFELSGAEKKELLELARSAVEAYVEDGRVIEYASTNSRFLAHRGLFVTLKKRGALRGCIGFIEPVMPLARGIVEAAIYAAVRDTRFEPVSAGELKSLEYEISVLTPLEDVPDPKLVKVGTRWPRRRDERPQGASPAAGPGREPLGPGDVPGTDLP